MGVESRLGQWGQTMQSCQLCGARSWGRVGDAAWSILQASEGPAVTGIERGKLRVCDSCGALAREDLITDPVLGVIGQPGGFTPPFGTSPPFDPVISAAQMMKGIIPERDPETRTERLVRELIRSETTMNDILISADASQNPARVLVLRAREIERELDRCAAHSPESNANLPGPGTPAPTARPRDFGSDFLSPTLAWAEKIGASKMVREMIPFALDTAILFGALEALTGNESLSDVVKLDAAYADKIQRLSRWVMS